jgi:hypothetical protein
MERPCPHTSLVEIHAGALARQTVGYTYAMRTRIAAASGILALLFPVIAFAFPFGGQAGLVVPCYNNAIYASLGPPRGGPYIWTPATKTYRFGPPTHAGQWLLGLGGAPYYCIVSILPIIVWSGTGIIMMGSSE